MLGGNSLNDNESFGVDDASGDSLSELVAVAKATGRSDDSYIRQLIGEAVILETLGQPTTSRINASLRAGRLPEAAASILRLMAGLTGYRRREIAMEIAGIQGVMRGAGDPRALRASAGSGPGSVRSAAAARRCSATASASASWGCRGRQPPTGACRSARCWPAAAQAG